MSISSTLTHNDYVGTGSVSTYSYNFKIIAPSDLYIYVLISGVQTRLNLTTDYTVTGVGNKNGGTITLLAGSLPTGAKITIKRVRPLTQTTDIRNQGDYYPEVIEDTFDNLTMIAQQIQNEVYRAVALPRSMKSTEFDPTLPLDVNLPSARVLVTKADGTGFQMGASLGNITDAIAAAANAAVSASNAAGSAANSATSATASAASATASAAQVSNAAAYAVTASNQVGLAAIQVTLATNQVGLAAAQVTLATQQANTASDWAKKTGATVDTTEYSAKEYAQGTTVASGSAKQWATKTTGFVDGTDYSAKYYALQAVSTVKVSKSGDTMTGPLAIQAILKLTQQTDNTTTGTGVTLNPTKSNYLITGAVVSIFGLTPPTNPDGTLILLKNGYTADMTIGNNLGTGTTDGILTGTGSGLTLKTGAALLLVYDITAQRWQVVGGSGSGGSTSPLTTKGDIIAHGVTVDERVAIGTNGQFLVVDTSQSSAVKWATLAVKNADVDAAAAIAQSKMAALTASKAMTTDSSGFAAASATSATELGYVAGVTSAIQTQINTVSTVAGAAISSLTGDVTATGPGSAATTISNLALSKLASVTASKALVSDGSGKVSASTVTSTELGYVSGATSNLQSQINTVSGTASAGITALTGDVTGSGPGSTATTIANLARTKLATGTANHVVINNGTGVVSSEAQLAKSRGGTGADNSSVTFPSTGTLATTGGTETFTNKTLTSPTLTTPTTDIETYTGQGSTPSSPSSGAYKSYVKSATGKVYILDNNGNEQLVGPTQGVVNYAVNPSAELGTTGVSVYANTAGVTPVTGTGGSPTNTITTNSTNPLNGTKSFYFSKAASNSQGMGWSTDFTLTRADVISPKIQTITYDFEMMTGNFVYGTSSADGDIVHYIVDLTSGAIIQPSGYRFDGGIVRLQFQPNYSSASYRLCWHIPTTSALSWVVKVDNIEIKPQSVSRGSFFGALPSYVPTTTGTTFTITGTSVTPYRKDDQLFMEFEATATAQGSGVYTFSLPPGLSFDSSVALTTFTSYGTNNYPNTIGTVIGDGAHTGSVGNQGYGSLQAFALSSTTFALGGAAVGANFNAASVNYCDRTIGVGSVTYGAMSACKLRIRITTAKIAGWSSNMQVSTDAESRVVSGKATISGSLAVTAYATIPFQTVLWDTHGCFSGGRYTVSSPGYYSVDGSAYASGGNTSLFIYVNGSNVSQGSPYSSPGQGAQVIDQLFLKVGDIVDLRCDTSLTLTNPPGLNRFSIHKILGPSQIAQSEKIRSNYGLTSTQAVAANGILKYDTKIGNETHGSYSTSTGFFTAPAPGSYLVTVVGYVATGTPNLYAKVNGASKGYFVTLQPGYILAGSITLDLVTGDTVGVYSEAAVTFGAPGTNGFSNNVTFVRMN